jgi:hypothetical protein
MNTREAVALYGKWVNTREAVARYGKWAVAAGVAAHNRSVWDRGVCSSAEASLERTAYYLANHPEDTPYNSEVVRAIATRARLRRQPDYL